MRKTKTRNKQETKISVYRRKHQGMKYNYNTPLLPQGPASACEMLLGANPIL